jgi:hypothetical protein
MGGICVAKKDEMNDKTIGLPRLTMAWCLAGLLLAAGQLVLARSANPLDSPRPPALTQLIAEHQRVLDQLNVKDAKGDPMELDDSRIPALVKKGWGLAGEWAAVYLESHPNPSTRELDGIFEGFAPKPHGVKSQYGDFLEYHDYSFTGSAFRIGAGIYVVQASYSVEFPTGTFMVVARNHDGHFQALWNIKELAEKHYAQRDEIGRWLYLVRRAYYNGPLAVSRIVPLRPLANGHTRFLVDAYQAADGGTALGQLSIWEWDGAQAMPLLVELFHHLWNSDGARFDGRTLRVSTKEELNTFSSCGGCPDPRGVWSIRITPDGVQDLGHRFLEPELQWADDLFSKVDKGMDTTELAEPVVVAALKARMQEEKVQHPPDPSLGPDFYWGMLDRCRVIRRGRGGAFELVLDEFQLRFSYVLRNGKPYFMDVKFE